MKLCTTSHAYVKKRLHMQGIESIGAGMVPTETAVAMEHPLCLGEALIDNGLVKWGTRLHVHIFALYGKHCKTRWGQKHHPA